MKTKLTTMALSVPIGSAILFANQTNGQAIQISPEWKAHFKTTPVIENGVFELISGLEAGGKGRTNLYQFRYQEDAFLLRQIRSLDEVSIDRIAPGDHYGGGYGSNYWAITFPGQLRLFPNAEKVMEERTDPNAVAVYDLRPVLLGVLYYGIGGLMKPASLEWTDETNFTALSDTGRKIAGKVTAILEGLPTALELHFEGASPEYKLVREYEYGRNFDLPYYPSEMRWFVQDGTKKQLYAIEKIMLLKTSPTPLDESFFDPDRYFVSSPSPGHIAVMVFSNGQSYAVGGDAHLQKVLSRSELAAMRNVVGNKAHTSRSVSKLIWPFCVGITSLAAIGLFILFKIRRSS